MLLTVQEVSEYLKISHQSVRTLGRTGALTRIYPIPRKLCFNAQEVRRYIESRGIDVADFDRFFNYKNIENETLHN